MTTRASAIAPPLPPRAGRDVGPRAARADRLAPRGLRRGADIALRGRGIDGAQAAPASRLGATGRGASTGSAFEGGTGRGDRTAADPAANAGDGATVGKRQSPPRPIFLGQVLAPARTDWRRLATIALVVAFFLWILSGFLARSDDTQRIARRLEEAARDVARQEAKVEALRTQVAYLSTDAYVEVAARERLGLVKPGDRPVIILPERDEVAWVPPAPPERPSGPFGPRYGHVDEWVRLLFGDADEGILGKR